jgi:hypothetical protein
MGRARSADDHRHAGFVWLRKSRSVRIAPALVSDCLLAGFVWLRPRLGSFGRASRATCASRRDSSRIACWLGSFGLGARRLRSDVVALGTGAPKRLAAPSRAGTRSLAHSICAHPSCLSPLLRVRRSGVPAAGSRCHHSRSWEFFPGRGGSFEFPRRLMARRRTPAVGICIAVLVMIDCRGIRQEADEFVHQAGARPSVSMFTVAELFAGARAAPVAPWACPPWQ